MSWRKISIRGLQIYCVLNVAIAVIGGGSFVLFGIEGLARFTTPDVLQSIRDIEGPALSIMDTWYRLLGWYWLVAGLMLLWITPRVQFSGAWFRFIHIGFMAAGIANAVLLLSGSNGVASPEALIPEFGIPLLAMFWQWRLELGNGASHEGA